MIPENFIKNGDYQKIFWLGVNGYIIVNERDKEILLIDPWPSYEKRPTVNSREIRRLANWLIKIVKEKGYKLVGVIGTHEHYDHIADIPLLYLKLKAADIELPPFYSDESTLKVVESNWFFLSPQILFGETVLCIRLKLHGNLLYYDDKTQYDMRDDALYPLIAGTKLEELAICNYLVTPYIWDHTSTSNLVPYLSDVKSGNYQRCTALFLKSKNDPEQKTLFLVGSAGEMNGLNTGSIMGEYVKVVKITTDMLIQAITHKVFLFETYIDKLQSLILYQVNNITVNDKIIATHFENFTDQEDSGRIKANYIGGLETFRSQTRIELYAMYLERGQEKWKQIYYMKRFLIEYSEEDIEKDIKTEEEVPIEEKEEDDFWLRFSTVSYF